MKQCLLNDTKLFKICGIYVQFSTIVHLNRSFHSLISKKCHSFFTRTYMLDIMVTILYYTFCQFRFPSILLPDFFYYIRFESTVHSSITSIPVSHHLDSFHLLHTARFRMSKTLNKKRESWMIDSSSSAAITRERALEVFWTVLLIMFTSFLKRLYALHLNSTCDSSSILFLHKGQSNCLGTTSFL